VEAVVRRGLPVVIPMIGMLICGLLRGPRPADAPAEPPPTAVTPQPSAETGDSPQPTGR